MNALEGLRLDLAGQPLMLKVGDAARLLGIGRTLAYDLANRFRDGDPTGLPVVWIGGCLRVPRWALAEWVLHGRVDADLGREVSDLVDAAIAEPAAVEPSLPHVARPRRRPVPVAPEQLRLGL